MVNSIEILGTVVSMASVRVKLSESCTPPPPAVSTYVALSKVHQFSKCTHCAAAQVQTYKYKCRRRELSEAGLTILSYEL